MNFEQQLLTTILGSSTGFLFALVLFWISESTKKRSSERQLGRNLILECQHNIIETKKLASYLKNMWKNEGELKDWRNSSEFPVIKEEFFKWHLASAFAGNYNFLDIFFTKALNSGLIFENIDTKDITDYLSLTYRLSDLPGWYSKQKESVLESKEPALMGKCLYSLFEGGVYQLEEYSIIATKLNQTIQDKYRVSI